MLIGDSTDNVPATNPITDAGATLGRVIFYDTRLSNDLTLSCATCHHQQAGFADTNAVSVGVGGALGTRNAMSLANARFYHRENFLWDEAAATLEDQVLMPITDPNELGTTVETVIERMEATTFYSDLFDAAFGSPDITSERMSLALAQFVRSIVSYRSRYDVGRALVRTETARFPNFTNAENRGKTLFFGRVGQCDNCHVTDLQILSPRPQNTGLDSITTDLGLGGVTGMQGDMGAFKVPSLRNIALSAPYMHDGRFSTLREVIEFYNSGVHDHPNLSPALQDPIPGDSPPFPARRLHLSTSDKADLLAFLRTLTDDAMITDAKWSDPFAQPLTLAVRAGASTVPAEGDTLTADVFIRNSGAVDFITTPTTTVIHPDGSTTVLVSDDVTLVSDRSARVAIEIPIAAEDLPGEYSVEVSAGGAPDPVSFTFEKLASGALAGGKQTRFAVTPAANAAASTTAPRAFALHDGYPNPFSGSVHLTLDVPKTTDVTVDVIDGLGRRVAVLVQGPVEAGTPTLRWEPRGVSSGVYVVRALARGERVHARRVTLLH